MMRSPYDNRPPRTFWRKAVVEQAALDPGDIYQPKFPIDRNHKVFTAGSCFAQHIGRTLRAAGFDVIDTEPVPDFVTDETAHRFGYRMFSARYGNIYTTRQLRQLVDDAMAPLEADIDIWNRDGRFFDAMRPNVEPDGLPSRKHVRGHRLSHLRRVRSGLRNADIFVFTFGLTEAWVNRETGRVYPTAPGTIAGDYEPDAVAFQNFGFNDIRDDFLAVRDTLRGLNPDIRFLITTSPVPLTATATDNHVEVATTRSKATLRAVCGELTEEFDDIDYYPSFEIITATRTRGAYFQSNLRSVSPQGVAMAMQTFLAAHGASGTAPADAPLTKDDHADAPNDAGGDDDAVCEEALLDAFAK